MSDKKPVVVTHSGVFHMDDVFAVATLKLLLGEIEIIRSRDDSILEKADYVVDTGFVYDPVNNRFDHHQKEGAGTRENKIPYASFGLVWKHFGEKITKSKEVRDRVDKVLVQSIDAFDNGEMLYESKFRDIHPYLVSNLSEAFNPTSFEDKNLNDQAFIELVSFAQKILEREIIQAETFQQEKKVVETQYEQSSDKRLIIFEEEISWLNAVEVLNGLDQEVLYIVKPSKQSNTWSAKTILVNRHTPESKKLFPNEWRGKTGKDLQEVTGVEDAIFCHRVPFICTAKSKEGAIKLAKLALEN